MTAAANETKPPAASVTGHAELDKALENILNYHINCPDWNIPQGKCDDLLDAYRAAKAAPSEPKAEPTVQSNASTPEQIPVALAQTIKRVDSLAYTANRNAELIQSAFADLNRDIHDLRDTGRMERADRQRLEGIVARLARAQERNARHIAALEESRPAPAASGLGFTAEQVRLLTAALVRWYDTEDPEKFGDECPFEAYAAILTGRIEPDAPEGEGKP